MGFSIPTVLKKCFCLAQPYWKSCRDCRRETPCHLYMFNLIHLDEDLNGYCASGHINQTFQFIDIKLASLLSDYCITIFLSRYRSRKFCFHSKITILRSSGQVKQLEMELTEVNREYAMLLEESQLMDRIKVEELQIGR